MIELIVQGDDFGMCHAVNQGVLRAFSEGIVTQASTMAPCPWFHEAAQIATDAHIPVGLHQTLTCEWDYLRWGPLTHAPSLCRDDGTLHATVAEAQAAHDQEEAAGELLAQAARATSHGLALGYLDVHMGMVAPEAYSVVSEKLGVPFLYQGLPTSLQFDSISMLSARPDKRAWLLDRIGRMEDGRHLIVSHPAVGGDEIRSITGPSSDPFPWAEEYRVSDLEVLTDPAIRQAIEDRGIRLVSVAG